MSIEDADKIKLLKRKVLKSKYACQIDLILQFRNAKSVNSTGRFESYPMVLFMCWNKKRKIDDTGASMERNTGSGQTGALMNQCIHLN